MEEDRMGFPRVRSPQQNNVGVFNFLIRTCSAARSEYRRQTDDAGGVSGAVAAVDVVRAEDHVDVRDLAKEGLPVPLPYATAHGNDLPRSAGFDALE